MTRLEKCPSHCQNNNAPKIQFNLKQTMTYMAMAKKSFYIISTKENVGKEKIKLKLFTMIRVASISLSMYELSK